MLPILETLASSQLLVVGDFTLVSVQLSNWGYLILRPPLFFQV